MALGLCPAFLILGRGRFQATDAHRVFQGLSHRVFQGLSRFSASVLAPSPGRWWAALAGGLCGLSLMAWFMPALWLDWQPELAWRQPWRAWTSVWVHWSLLHLGANLLAAAVVGAYGYTARVPALAAWAWLMAWPLTQVGMLLLPDLSRDLLHYGGLSGMLHGGVAIVCAELLCFQRGSRRWVGAAVSLGLVVKLVSEAPWGPVLRSSPEWDISVVPLAHSTGAAAGLLCWAVLRGAGALRRA